MVPVMLAWGPPSLFAISTGVTLYGCQFEMVPGATMANAACAVHGVVGCEAELDDRGAEPLYRTVPDPSLSIYAMGDTETMELEPHQNAIIDSYRLHMAQLGLNAST